jgi:hypothetical protein
MMTVKGSYLVLMSAWRAPDAIIPAGLSRAVLALMFAGSLVVSSLAMTGDPSRFRPGLRNSPETDGLSAEQLDIILKSLREKTGFLELRFGKDGFLTLGDRTRIAGGSAAARALMIAAVDGRKAILLKSRHRSSEVVFARVTLFAIYKSVLTRAQIEAQSLELDFFDFDQLRGDQRVISAFDPGLTVLHELGHAVLALQDDKASAQGLGDCEEHINRIRRELGLPERQHYAARVRRTMQFGLGVRTSEMLFIQQEEAKTRHFYLRWETDKVGQSKEELRPTDSLRGPSSMIAKQ